VSVEADLRRLIAQGEGALHDGGWRGQGKEPLLPQYRMLLRMLARVRPATEARIDDWLRVVRALRDEHELAALPDPALDHGADSPLDSPLAVLSAYLRRLPDHVLLAIEPGADVLTWLALRGGPGPPADRVALACATPEGVHAIEQLIAQHQADVERLQRGAPVDETLYEPMRRAAQQAWDTLPPAVAALLAPAPTVLYWASPFGSLGELPLELLHDGTQWLGISHVIGRVVSWRTLLEMLSPNRMPSSLAPRARIVRANDLAGTDELDSADPEIAAVERQLQHRGLTAVSDRAPTRASMRAALDAGDAVVHFIGHGMAGSMGEYLPLDGDAMLRPEDLSELSGWRSPFVYLSTCELGRSRAGRSGRALGFAPRMIEKGVPAAIGCIQPIDDEVALEMARAVYGRPAPARMGEALAQARQQLEAGGYPPACWGAYVLFGDPNLVLPTAASELGQTRHLTRAWSTFTTRWAALRSPRVLAQARAALAAGDERSDGLPPADRAFVARWLESSFSAQSGPTYVERDAFCDRIAPTDPLAAAALRILLTFEALEDTYARADPPLILADPAAELARALHAARAIHDMLAWPVLAIRFAGVMSSPSAPARLQAQRLLDEAEGALQGWVSEEPDAAPLLEAARQLRQRVAAH
jgi:CHAT domain-containing protein